MHRGDHKFGNFLAFELRWQLARLHGRLEALGDRSSNFRKNLGQATANILAVLVQLGGHIPVEATVLCAGRINLFHRVVMAPLTRQRSEQPGDVPGPLMVEYYAQRASEGGLIISEATTVAITGRGYLGAPGIYSDQQVAGWKKVVDAVHAKGGRMLLQLWHVGRVAMSI